MRTVGVEEEFLLFESTSPRPAEVGADVASSADAGSEDAAQFEAELKRSQVEHATEPVRTVAELADQLRSRRRHLVAAAREQDARLVASGTCPVPARSRTADKQRYHQMASRYAEIERRTLTCAMHVHVAVQRGEGPRVLTGIGPWLPVLTALSANSPYHDGRDTGYASYRRIIWSEWPTAGPTAPFADEADYRDTVEALIASGAARDEGMIYFDARLSARFPTVEIRVCDVVPAVEQAALLAALCRGLVERAAAADLAPAADGGVVRPARPEIVRAAHWRAARFGLTDSLVLPGATDPVPAGDAVDALFEHVRRHLGEEAGWVRDHLDRLRERGTGAQLQRRAGSPEAAVDAVTVS